MSPLSYPWLYLLPVADHWSRSDPEQGSQDDILDALIKSYWRGEIEIDTRAISSDGDHGRRLLLRMLRFITPPEHKHLIFFEGDDEPEPDLISVYVRNDEIMLDINARVKLPEDPADWTEDDLNKACHEMASLRIKYYPPAALPILQLAKIHRDQVAVFCDVNGWPRPSFWFAAAQPSSPVATKTADLVQCRRWLREQARRLARPRKAELLAEAKRRFPSLSQRAFQQLWRELAPEAWHKAGRPPIRPRR
jgi:hypothetical protein